MVKSSLGAYGKQAMKGGELLIGVFRSRKLLFCNGLRLAGGPKTAETFDRTGEGTKGISNEMLAQELVRNTQINAHFIFTTLTSKIFCVLVPLWQVIQAKGGKYGKESKYRAGAGIGAERF